MRLPSDGREYAVWTFTNLPVDITTIDVTFFAADTWHAAPVTVTGSLVEAKVLVAGPDADDTGAVVLPLGKVFPTMRVTDAPEIVIRQSDPIYVFER